MQEIIGKGAYGQVARCQNINTKGTVAVKFIKDAKDFKSGHREVKHTLTLIIIIFLIFPCPFH